MRERLQKWGRPVLFVVAVYSCAYMVGFAFAQGISKGGGLFHLTVNYTE